MYIYPLQTTAVYLIELKLKYIIYFNRLKNRIQIIDL